MTTSDQAMQAKLVEIDELVTKILNKMEEVETAHVAFINLGPWDSLLQSKGIHPDSLVTKVFWKATLSFSVLSLARLWDKKQRTWNKITFPDLFSKLDEATLDAILKRAIDRLADPEGIPGYNDIPRMLCNQARHSIIEDYDHLRSLVYPMNGDSYIRLARDKWIAHNEDFDEFDDTEIQLLAFETATLFRRTKNLFERVNALIRDADFKWDSIGAQIKGDLHKMFYERPIDLKT